MVNVYLYLDKERTQLFQLIDNWTNRSPLALPKGTKTGYDFVNWINEDGKAVTKLFPFNDDSITDVYFYATWTPSTNTKYKVWHLKSSVDSNILQQIPDTKATYSNLVERGLLAEEEVIGTTDDPVLPLSKEYPGFIVEKNDDESVKAFYYRENPNYATTADKKYIEELDDEYKGKIRPDGTTLIVYRYTRRNYVTTFVDTFDENDFIIDPLPDQHITVNGREVTSYYGLKVELSIYQPGYNLAFYPKSFIKSDVDKVYYYVTPASDSLVYIEKDATKLEYTIRIHYRTNADASTPYTTFAIKKEITTNTAPYYRFSLTDASIKEAIIAYIDANTEKYNTTGVEFYKALCDSYTQENIEYSDDHTSADVYYIAKKVSLTINFTGGQHKETKAKQIVYRGFPGTKIFIDEAGRPITPPSVDQIEKFVDSEYYTGCRFVSDDTTGLIDNYSKNGVITTILKSEYVIYNNVVVNLEWIPRKLKIYYANSKWVLGSTGQYQLPYNKDDLGIDSGYIILDDFYGSRFEQADRNRFVEEGFKFVQWDAYSYKTDGDINSHSIEKVLGVSFDNKAAVDIYENRKLFNAENNFTLYLVAYAAEIPISVTIVDPQQNVDYYAIDHDDNNSKRNIHGDIGAKRPDLFKELMNKSNNKELPTRLEVLEEYVNHLAKFLGQTNQETYKKLYNNNAHTSMNEGLRRFFVVESEGGNSIETDDDFILIGEDTYSVDWKDFIYTAHSTTGANKEGATSVVTYYKVENFGPDTFYKKEKGDYKKTGDTTYEYVGMGFGDYTRNYFDDIHYYYLRASQLTSKYTNILNYFYDNKSTLFRSQIIKNLPTGLIYSGNNTITVNLQSSAAEKEEDEEESK